MIFADKLIKLRKNNNWSQEELAELIGVSRQSVSKWEVAQSIPDLNKIVKLSELFDVSTDFLLKDNIEEIDRIYLQEEIENIHSVSVEEANDFLSIKKKTSKKIALATFLCIISPICLLILDTMSEEKKYNISENMASGIGIIVLFIFIISSVILFISSGFESSPYEYLDKESVSIKYGVSGIVKEKQKEYRKTYEKHNILGVIICCLSIVPFFIGIIINENNNLLMVYMVSLFFIIVGIGVMFFIRVGIIWKSYQKILRNVDYSKEKIKDL